VAENQDDEAHVVETEEASAGGPNTHDSAPPPRRARNQALATA
jgi:hypothetical protein